MKTKYYLLILLLPLLSCKKDWLAEKRDLAVIIPSTLQDLRLLLNNETPLNFDKRALMESSCDDFYVSKTQFESLTTVSEHNAIIWKKDLYEGSINVRDWDDAYKIVLYCNVILEALEKIERNNTNAIEYDNIKGNALFFRSRAFLNLVLSFSKYYNPATSNTDLGIPLKLSADINEKVTRATVQQTYDKIMEDLTVASGLLPTTTALKTDASKVACYGLLARCYLFMNKYERALEFSKECYKWNNFVIDYNTLNPNLARPIPAQSDETHIYSQLTGGILNASPGYSNIDEDLYNSYSNNDLRKSIFYSIRTDGGIDFKGSYTGTGILFGGTATDEILLIMAECKALLEDVSGAMQDLNILLIKRFKTGTFVPFTANDKISALKIIRTERRKELVRRGLRWQDLKRYNQDPLFSKTLTRTIDGVTYSLPPNDPRYVLSIPEYIIQFNAIEQNLR